MPISLRPCTDYNLNCLTIHKCNNYLTNLDCNCEKIEEVTHYKYLGIFFDRRMSWSYHINFLANKIRKYSFAFRQLKEVLDEKEIKMAYFGYCQSLLAFGNIAWGGASPTTIHPLFVAQKKLLKIAFNKPARYPTESLFNELAVLSVRKLFVKNLLIHTFCNKSKILSEITHTHNTRYALSIGINTPQLSKAFSKTNSYYIANTLYRNICKYYRHMQLFHVNSISAFKIRTNKWLLQMGNQVVESLITADFRPIQISVPSTARYRVVACALRLRDLIC